MPDGGLQSSPRSSLLLSVDKHPPCRGRGMASEPRWPCGRRCGQDFAHVCSSYMNVSLLRAKHVDFRMEQALAMACILRSTVTKTLSRCVHHLGMSYDYWATLGCGLVFDELYVRLPEPAHVFNILMTWLTETSRLPEFFGQGTRLSQTDRSLTEWISEWSRF